MNSIVADTAVQRALGIVVLINIAWVIAMSLEVKRFEIKNQILGKFESPVVALELADSPERVRAILDQGNRANNIQVMMWNTWMDFLFIVLYCLTLWLLADAYISGSVLPLLAKIAIVVTGTFDIIEDIQLCREFRMVADLGQSTVSMTRGVSLTKWTAFAIALGLLAVYYWLISGSSVLLKLISLSAGAAAALTAVGLFNNSIINFMSLPLGLAILFTLIKFFPFRHLGS
jgi:hypothetical protein